MSTKASISSSKHHHLYYEASLDTRPDSVFFELNEPNEFSITKEVSKNAVTESLVVEIPALVMDDIAIAWVKKRGLEGAF